MADTHQSNQYEKLVRRIGYSVGLEDLVDRIDKLVLLYVKEREINIALWKNLVKEVYGRKVSDEFESSKWGGSRKTNKKLGAEDHFADFYSELNLLYRRNSQVFPLYGLEILSIIRRYYDVDHSRYYASLKSLILLFILEADGDIFLNCLIGRFEKEAVKSAIFQMFKTKKETYSKVYLSTYSLKKVLSVFKVQSTSASLSVFDRKSQNDEIEIPDDYLSKIIPTRKNWAAQLGLFTNVLESEGYELLSFLKQKHVCSDTFAAFYPYRETHKAMLVDEEKAGIYSLSRIDFIKGFFEFSLKKNEANRSELSRDEVYGLLWKIMELYKEGNKIKGIIRHQLPLQVLFPVFYIILSLSDYDSFDLNLFIKEEQKAIDRKLDVLHLRGNETEGAITLRT